MKQTEVIGLILTAFLPMLVGIMAIITPIMKLNTTIAKLDSTMEEIKKQNTTQDARINKHSEEIEHLNRLATEHEVKIKNLENRDCKYEAAINK